MSLTASGPLLSSPPGEGVDGLRPKKAKTCGGQLSRPSLAAQHPGIEAFWVSWLNEGPIPDTLTSGSGKVIWLQCHGCLRSGEEHTWSPKVNNLPAGPIQCPCCKLDACPCRSVASMPHLVREWHKDNQVGPKMVGRGSGAKFAWKCEVAGCGWE